MLMLRSKWILFMMIIMPLFTIALLSNAFRSMMNTNVTIEEFKVGYRVNSDSDYKTLLAGLQDNFKEQNIILQEYPQGDIHELMQNRTVAVFVKIEEDNRYQLYQSSENKMEAALAESVFSSFFYQVKEARLIADYSIQNQNYPPKELNRNSIQSEILPVNPMPSADDYYGIIYIVYFAWCGLISLVAVISSERKNAIPRRMRVAQMPKASQYLGKLIPCSLTIFIQTCTGWILSVLIFDIHWGNIFLSTIIIALISLATSALGIVLFQLFHNVAISVVIGFVITWIWGFFGGAFQSYMYLDLPKFLILSSPIYHINRTLVEFSTMGHSEYLNGCILYLGGIIVGFALIGILLTGKKTKD